MTNSASDPSVVISYQEPIVIPVTGAAGVAGPMGYSLALAAILAGVAMVGAGWAAFRRAMGAR